MRDKPSSREEKPASLVVSRRGFLKGVGAGVLTQGVLGVASGQQEAAVVSQTLPTPVGPGATPMTLIVNGQVRSVELEPRTTLLNALRNHLDLTGAKQVCDRGQCGACTVLVDGVAVLACMTLAIDVQGKQIQTIEGLAQGEQLHPIQQEFIAHDALQCGFCTPGMIMKVKDILDHNPRPTLEEVKEGLAGNICRCGTYNRIFEATLAAARRMRGGD